MIKPQIDFAIVTAIYVEFRAICEEFEIEPDDKDYVGDNSRTYYRKRLSLKGGEFYEIVVALAPDKANVNSALLVRDINEHWEPNAILLVGIAGAAIEEVHLGDLVIASNIFFYERGFVTAEEIISESQMFQPDFVLFDRAQNFAMWITEEDWTNRISLAIPDMAQSHPKIHNGVIASGEKVVADSAFRDKIAAQHHKIIAIEMEGYGFSEAIRQQFIPTRHLVIKAISDLADSGKNDEWQPYAAAVAASFTKHFLLNRPLEPRNPPEVTPDPSGFDPRFRNIISSFKNGTIVPFLGSGINWCDRNGDFNNEMSDGNSLFDIEIAKQLAEVITRERDPQNNESQLGVPCLICYGDLENFKNRSFCSPILDQITGGTDGCNYNETLSLEQKLAIAKLDFRFLSKYLILEESSEDFYLTLDRFYKEHSQPNKLHNFLANLYKKRDFSGERVPYQLITTTNIDNLLEKAFEEARQSFDIVFYVSNCHKFKHKRYKYTSNGILDTEDFGVIENPNAYENFAMAEYPVILKFFGSLEEKNCVITEDHQIDYLTNKIFEFQVPNKLREIIKQNKILFLGYGFNDYDLKLVLSQSSTELGKSYLIYPLEPNSFDRTLWENRKVKVNHIKCSLKYCLKQLELGIDKIIMEKRNNV